MFVAPLMNGDTITGIVVESKAGREAILAQRVIDATGDADVALRAGAPTHTTPLEQMQAASVMFHLAGVDKKTFMAGVREDSQTYKDWSTGEWAIETSGKEDARFSPFLKKPFAQAIRDGVIPTAPEHDCRRLGRDTRLGRADLHEPGAPGWLRRHRPRQHDPLRDRGPQTGDAGCRGAAPLHPRLRRHAAA